MPKYSLLISSIHLANIQNLVAKGILMANARLRSNLPEPKLILKNVFCIEKTEYGERKEQILEQLDLK